MYNAYCSVHCLGELLFKLTAANCIKNTPLVSGYQHSNQAVSSCINNALDSYHAIIAVNFNPPPLAG